MPNEIPQIFGAGSFDSRLIFKKHTDGEMTEQRTVTHYEIDMFTADGGVTHINENRVPIKKGLLLFARPGDKRQSRLHFNAQFVHFTSENGEINNMLSFVPALITVPDFDKYFEALKKTADAFHGLGKYDGILASGMLTEFLHTLYTDSLSALPDTERVNRSKGLIGDSIDFIKVHYGEHLGIDDIARYCNLSTSYFYKVFTGVTGTTPNDFLTATRLAASKTMLSGTDRSISDIAEACGFGSQSYFCYAFKKEYGTTPSGYRESHRYFSL